MEDGLFIMFSVGGLCGESIIAMSECKYLYFQFGLHVKGGLSMGGAPKMHNVSGLTELGIYILVDSMCM
jgi:hypothetical protein